MMKIWKAITFYVKLLFSGVNVLKTIIFNCRLLPLKEAIRLPILLYGKVDISQCDGNIKWLKGGKPHKGSWIIGQTDGIVAGSYKPYAATSIVLRGTLILGEYGRIANGSIVAIKKGASLSLGTNCIIQANGRIGCYNHISIGDNVRLSWECQVFDSNFHYLMYPDGSVPRNNSNVRIGNNCWIGNRSTIAKGGGIGDNCILASYSLLNKDYSNIQGGVFCGIPAIHKFNAQRIFWPEENFLDGYFSKNPNENIYKLQ